MNKKYKKIAIIIIVISVITLLIDLIVFLKYKNNSQKTYFDSINSFEIYDNYYIAVGSNNNNNNNFEKAKITKYDSNKEKIWEKLYSTGYNSSFFAVTKDKNSYVAVGDYEKTKKEQKEKVRSALTVKISEDGHVESEKSFQVLGDSKFTNIKVVEDGYIVTGQSIYENMTLGLSDKGGAFVVKYDKNLKEIWKVNYGGSKSAIYNDLEIVNNYIYAVGKDSTRLGIISKYDMNGNEIKTETYSYTDTLGFTGIKEFNNKLYVVGAKKVTEDENDYNTDALIVNYDFECNKVTEKIYYYKNDTKERFNRIIIDSNKNIVTIGSIGTYLEKKFNYDGMIAKYDENLEKLDVVNYSNDKDDYFTEIKQEDDKYIISGYSTYNDNSYLSKLITYSKSLKPVGTQ